MSEQESNRNQIEIKSNKIEKNRKKYERIILYEDIPLRDISL